jgi:hypothetical protein
MATHTHGDDVFRNAKSSLRASDEMAVWEGISATADDAPLTITFPDEILDLLGDVTGFRSL